MKYDFVGNATILKKQRMSSLFKLFSVQKVSWFVIGRRTWFCEFFGTETIFRDDCQLAEPSTRRIRSPLKRRRTDFTRAIPKIAPKASDDENVIFIHGDSVTDVTDRKNHKEG